MTHSYIVYAHTYVCIIACIRMPIAISFKLELVLIVIGCDADNMESSMHDIKVGRQAVSR